MIHLELFRADVTCLANHLPVGSDLRYKLVSSGQSFGDSKHFEFSIDEAPQLLRIAREHCPEAVVKILKGIALSTR